jgi:ATP-dependent protease ClpP protease subunit
LFNFIAYVCLILANTFVSANATNASFKETIFKHASDSQRIEVIRQNSNECISGTENYIELTGAINQNTVLVIERLLTQLPNCKLQFGVEKNLAIYLNSKGGRAHDGVKLGRLFRKYNIKALVRNDQLCASACAFAFIGAKYRSIGSAAELLFHAPFKKKLFGITCESSVDSQWLQSYFIEMLGEHQGRQLFDKTISTCDVNKGWVVNEKKAKFLKIIKQ